MKTTHIAAVAALAIIAIVPSASAHAAMERSHVNDEVRIPVVFETEGGVIEAGQLVEGFFVVTSTYDQVLTDEDDEYREGVAGGLAHFQVHGPGSDLISGLSFTWSVIPNNCSGYIITQEESSPSSLVGSAILHTRVFLNDTVESCHFHVNLDIDADDVDTRVLLGAWFYNDDIRDASHVDWSFWVPLSFFAAAFVWALWHGWTYPALVATLPVIGLWFTSPLVAIVTAWFLVVLAFWLQYYATGRRLANRERGGF